jgi:hypothetical protein
MQAAVLVHNVFDDQPHVALACVVLLQLAQVLDALVQEAESVQKHQPQLHALYLQDAPAALADACSSSTGASGAALSAAGAADVASLAAAQEAVAGSSAAALAMISMAGSSAASGRSADPNTPSNGGGGGLFGGGGGKLLDVLLGRRNSAGLGDIDRAMNISSSRRASQECSRAATPQHGNAPNVAVYGLSRTVSHEVATAMTPIACSAGGRSRQVSSCCSSRCQAPCMLQGSCLHQLAGAVDGGMAELADEGGDCSAQCLKRAESAGCCQPPVQAVHMDARAGAAAEAGTVAEVVTSGDVHVG